MKVMYHYFHGGLLKFRPAEYACIFPPNIVRQGNSVIRGMNMLLINIPSVGVKNVNKLLFRQTGDFFFLINGLLITLLQPS